MKNRCWSLLVILLSFWLNSNAQAPDEGWFNISTNTIKGAYQHKVLGADLQGYYVYQSNGRERVLEKYSYNNTMLYAHKIPLDDRSIEIEELLVRRNDVVVFFSIFNGSLRKHGLFYMLVPHQGEPSKPVILMDMDQISNRARSYFRITPNDDLSGFSAMHENQHRPDETILEISFFNALIQPVSNTRLLLPMTGERYEISRLTHDGNYNLYMMMRSLQKDKKLSDPERISYKIIKIDRFTLQADELKLGSSIYFLNSMQLGYDRLNQRIKLAGLISDKERAPLSGVVLATIHPDSFYFDTIGFSRFDPEFAGKVQSYKSSKKEKELTDYFLGDLIIRDDGGVVLLGESNYQTNQTYVQYSQGFPIYREIIYYHYDELIMVSINPNGSLDWRQIIPKKQTSVTPSPYFSYLAFAVGSEVHIIYNEEGRSKTSVMLYSISNTGAVSPRSLLNADAAEAMILPADARIVSPNTILIPANKRKKKGVFRLTFGEA
jgi:hypothetical protein